MTFEDIKKPLSRVLEAIQKDRSKLAAFTWESGNVSITAERLDWATGNHMCDDRPEWFDITEHEGHMIRQYFQENGLLYGWRDYVLILHREFPDIMEQEDPRYIKETNHRREKDGLPLIQLD